MKIWESPKLCNLGIENTHEDVYSAVNHFCHNGDNDLSGNCNGKPNDHHNPIDKQHTFTGNLCEEHNLTGNSSCCCLPGVS